MGVFASRQDLIASYEGELTERQLVFAETKILEAEALLMTLVPRLAGGPAAVPQLVRTNATRAVCAAVLRVVRNPAGVSYQATGGYTTRLSDNAATGELFFSTEELAPLRQRRRRVGVLGIAPVRWSA
ncbi:Gp19/Gp15/Gp42 family protein [Nocardia sp. CA-128927]|uniref:Gp19/Gp15/Gp42 family protein n=1 Tax=Nocardia sp. CA-128927 TaxID=3239975 RepID=UPI003D96791D